MEYKGKYIEDRLVTTDETQLVKYTGDNNYGEILISKEEMSKLIDVLVSVRDTMNDCDELKFDMSEGYSGDFVSESDPATLYISILTKNYESDENMQKRIEKRKAEIDEAERMSNEILNQRKKNHVKSMIKQLEEMGYTVHK